MSLKSLIARKIRSAKFRLHAFLDQQKQRASERRKVKLAKCWLESLTKTSAEVLIGANFVEMGGCRQHMHSLANFSSLETELVPNTKTMSRLHASDFTCIYKDFLKSPPSPKVKAVHSHVFPWFINWCIEQRRNIPLWVHTHHAWYFDEYNDGTKIPWHEEFNHAFLQALSQCDVPISVSRWQQQFLLTQFGIKTHYLPNGVDLSLCLRGNAQSFRSSTGLHEKFVLWVGRNDPVKNPAEILQLAHITPGISYCLVGPDLTNESMQRQFGVSTPDNVTYTGQLSQAEVQNAIAACSALVITSRREGLPTLVLEGLAHQKPLVVPNETGCVEALGGPKFGYIYELGNLPSLKTALKTALAGPPQLPEGLERIRDEFDWPVIMRKLDRVYRGGPLEHP